MPEISDKDGMNLLDAMTAGGSAGLMRSPGVMPRGMRVASADQGVPGTPPQTEDQTPQDPGLDAGSGDLASQAQAYARRAQARAAGEPESVPIEAHKGRIARLAKKNETLQQQLQDLQRKLEAKSQPPSEIEMAAELAKAQKPVEWEAMSPEEQTAWYAVQAAKRMGTQVVNPTTEQVRALERRLKDMEHFRGYSEEQMSVIDEIRQLHPTLADRPQQILALAKMEEPALFRDMGASGTPFVGRPGRGSSEEMRQQGPPTARQVADFLSSLPPDDPRARDIGPWLIKADMEERYPNVQHARPSG